MSETETHYILYLLNYLSEQTLFKEHTSSVYFCEGAKSSPFSQPNIIERQKYSNWTKYRNSINIFNTLFLENGR